MEANGPLGLEQATSPTSDPPVGLTVRGRWFTTAELAEISSIVESSPDEHRFALSKRICAALDWRQPNGRLKDRACRAVLARLDALGLLRLPPPRRLAVARRAVPITERTAPCTPRSIAPREVGLHSFTLVGASRAANPEGLWNEYVERYHALGYGVPVGPRLKYFVDVDAQPIACIAFAGAAWSVEARDRWIGWSSEQRQRGLPLVVNNTRFVIFPWARSKNLASRILSLAAKRMRADWAITYGYEPLLLETFVDLERHSESRGSSYRAANWRLVGVTKGRGKLDRHFEANKSKKAVLLYPLVEDVQRRLSTI